MDLRSSVPKNQDLLKQFLKIFMENHLMKHYRNFQLKRMM